MSDLPQAEIEDLKRLEKASQTHMYPGCVSPETQQCLEALPRLIKTAEMVERLRAKLQRERYVFETELAALRQQLVEREAELERWKERVRYLNAEINSVTSEDPTHDQQPRPETTFQDPR